jgi:AcrR family transcriptional regulator
MVSGLQEAHSSQQRRHALSSRERSREAAKSLFSQKGYESTSLSEIARLAGTSESQIVHHFGSKAGLLRAVFEDAWEQINRAVRLAIAKSPSSLDKLKRSFNIVLASLEKDAALGTLLLLEGVPRLRRGQHMIVLTHGYQEFIETLDGILKEIADRGELAEQIVPEAFRSGIIGLVEGMLRHQLLARISGFPASYSEADIWTLVSTLLLACLRSEHQKPRILSINK